MTISCSTKTSKRPAVWYYKIFNLNSFAISAFILFFSIVEIRFDVIEKMTGNYLKWNNHGRQKLGRLWDIKQQNIAAMGQLNDLLIEKEDERKKIEKIESFRELFEHLKTDRLITLTKEQFTKIYNRLPLTISSKIIDPYNLINFFHRSEWVKTFVFQKETGMELVMVDGQYGVLNSILISDQDTNYMANFGKIIPSSLENIEELSNRIYDAREFMDALFSMNRDERNKIILNPVNFLEWGNRLKRIGISEISEDNLVQVGFELHTLKNKEVVIVYIDDFLISKLLQHLSGEEIAALDFDDEVN